MNPDTQMIENKPKQARALLKRQALISAGIVEFGVSGFAGATSKLIAARAGVATGTFYQNFDNKDQLLREIAQQRVKVLKENVRAIKVGDFPLGQYGVENIFKDALTFIYEFHKSNPELHQVLEERRHLDPALATVLRGGEDELVSRLMQFVRAFNMPKPEITASNLFAMTEGLVHRHVFEGSELNSQDVIDQGAKMLAAFFENSR